MTSSRPLRRFLKNRGARVGLVLVLAVVALSAVGPWLGGHGGFTPDFVDGIGPYGTPAAPSSRHWLGTDTIFRDLFVRLSLGGRLSLSVAVAATIISTIIGTVVGMLAGWFSGQGVHLGRVVQWLGLLTLGITLLRSVGGGLSPGALHTWLSATLYLLLAGSLLRLWRAQWLNIDLDNVLMRAVDVLMAFPFLLLLMALGAALGRTTAFTIVLVLGLTSWTGTARIVRSKVLQVRELEFVQASRALGQNVPRILFLHLLPNLTSVLVVLATNALAGMIVAEAALSFLGLSIPPPTASWGRMLDEGRPYYAAAPWLLLAPSLAILASVLGFNLVGEGLRDALDPKET